MLSHFQALFVAQLLWVAQITNNFVVDLHHREANLKHRLIAALLFALDLVEQVLANSRYDALVLTVADDRVRLSATRLAIGEQRRIVAVESILCSK